MIICNDYFDLVILSSLFDYGHYTSIFQESTMPNLFGGETKMKFRI